MITMAMVVFIAAAHIPLPGAPVASVGETNVVVGAKLFEFSFVVWFGSLAAAEFLRLLLPKVFPAALQRRGHVDPYNHWLIIISMVLIAAKATQQVVEIETALQAADYRFTPFAQPLYAVSAIAGFAVLLALGKWIEGSGVSCGFWFITGAFYLLWWNSFLPTMLAELQAGLTTKSLLLMSAAGLAMNIALLAWAVLPLSTSGDRNAERMIWPWFIGMVGSPHVVDLFSNLDFFNASYHIQQDRSLADAATNAVIVLFTSVFAFRNRCDWRRLARLLGFYCLYFASQDILRRHSMSWLQVDGFLLVLLLWAATAVWERVRRGADKTHPLPQLRQQS